ncbi:hypothetical protein [Nocardiopsis lucentensis]|uniref:hypothetical protein n=1 Tax=Nocardiopsis lucentensis TaxID=53441 RepID=UPI0003470326|nr:hypothetical protein [Nocardiopsis lucentensis]
MTLNSTNYCMSITSDPHWPGYGLLEIDCQLPEGHAGHHRFQRSGHFPPAPIITWDDEGGTWVDGELE